ncbi:MAG: NrsF family protein [Alphaproteobacteria bacterium]|nr:NrsF family protein [Alphaproteobacteria bacterium]
MKTDDLIHILSSATPPRPPMSLVAALVLLAVFSFALVFFWEGVRPDLLAGDISAGLLFKTGFLSAVFVVSLFRLRRCAGPRAYKAPVLDGLYMMLWVGLAAFVLLRAVTVPHDVLASMYSAESAVCLPYVTFYGVVGLAVLLRLMQHYAPADPQRAAGMSAAAAAAAGALGYMLHCPMDDPAHLLVAYGLPVLLLSFLGGRYAARFLRW